MEQTKKIREMLEDDDVSFDEFREYLQENDIGYWDGVNDKEIILQYVNEMMNKGIIVSHILKALEDNPSDEELYEIWLGNSMETPTPINNKKELFDALQLGDEE